MERETERRKTASTKKDGLPVVGTTRARQAAPPGQVRYVVTISMVLVIVVFAIFYFLNFGS